MTGKYGTRYALTTNASSITARHWDSPRSSDHGKTRLTQAIQIWCLSAKASEEDGDHTTCSVHLYILRQGHRQAPFGRHLELQIMQEVCCWRCLDSLVSEQNERTREISGRGSHGS